MFKNRLLFTNIDEVVPIYNETENSSSPSYDISNDIVLFSIKPRDRDCCLIL